MNTHRAVIETSVPPGMEIVGAGNKAFCQHALRNWIDGHPLKEFEVGLVLKVEEEL